MEKINTPLMSLLEWVEQKDTHISTEIHLQYVRDKIEELLPTERKIIDIAFNKGKIQQAIEISNHNQPNVNGRDYFTQTFDV